MDEGLKKRLLGATVLVSLVVIFVPMLLEKEPVIETGIYRSNIPQPPGQLFSDRLVPAEDQLLVAPEQIERATVVPLRSAIQPSAGTTATVAPVTKQTGPTVTRPTTAAPVPRVGLTAWVVQVGSFSNQPNAERLVADLRKKGFSAFLEQAEISGTMHFRVKVGPEADRALAEKMLISLDKALKPMKLKGSLQSYP